MKYSSWWNHIVAPWYSSSGINAQLEHYTDSTQIIEENKPLTPEETFNYNGHFGGTVAKRPFSEEDGNDH